MKLPGVTIILAKTAGIAGLGLVGYDAYTAGKIQSNAYVRNAKTTGLARHSIRNLTMDSPSVLNRDLKKQLFRFNTDENITGFFNSIIGFTKGTASMLINNLVPLGLSLGAVLTHGTTSKFFGLGLVGYGAVVVAQEIFGMGKPENMAIPY